MPRVSPPVPKQFGWLLCGCQAHYTRDRFFLFSFMTFVLPDQRETCCYAWHGTRPSHLLKMRPSLRHKAPGSLSQGSNRQEFFSPGSPGRRVVPWGDVSSWGQRSRMNFLSHHIGPLFHQHRSNPGAELARHSDDGDPRTHMPGVSAANRAVKLPKLGVLANRRPRRLDQFTPQPAVPGAGDRAAIGFLSGRVLGRNHAQKSCELAHVFKLPPVADTGQELTGHNPANPTNTHHILNALRQLRVVLAKLANFFTHLNYLLLRKLHPVQQLIELEAYALRALKLSQLGFTFQRPLAPSRRQRERDAFEKQQRFDPLLGPGSLTHQRVAQLREVA